MKTTTRALVAGAATTAIAISYGALAAPSGASHAPHATFGTPVVVDLFHPGYEPDLAIAKAGKYKGSTYSSVPNGFSTTISYLWRSDDNRRSFHFTEGNALGKQATCVGGGDTELQVDPVNGDVYFNDLQGLTNFTNSRSTDGGHTWETSCSSVNGVGVDRQWIGIDSNGGKSAVGSGANDGRLYFDYDNVEQNGGQNQLVMNESVDGVHYGNKCELSGAPCALPPAVISPDEGIPGNIVVDNVPGSAFQHRVYAIHTDSANSGIIVSYCGGLKTDKTAAQVADYCTDPTKFDPSDSAHVNTNWHDSFVLPKGNWQGGYLFPSIAVDTKGTLYAVWAQYPGQSAASGPGAIKLAISRDGAKSWSKPVTISPKSLGNNVMPWVVAGTPGRVGVAWYGSTTAKSPDGKSFGPDAADNAVWNLYYSTSINALGKNPAFGMTKVSDHPVKYGNISTQGLGGSPDRSLGDFFQVQMGLHGEAVISYVDDTSADRNQDTCQGCGETPAEAAGPVMVVSQNGGPSLLAGKTVPPSPKRFGRVQDKPGDAFLAAAGQDIKAPARRHRLEHPPQGRQEPARHVDDQRQEPGQPLGHDTATRRTGRQLDGPLGGADLQGQWRRQHVLRRHAVGERTEPDVLHRYDGCDHDHAREVLHLSGNTRHQGSDPGRDDLVDRSAVADRQPGQGPGSLQRHRLHLDAGRARRGVDGDGARPGRRARRREHPEPDRCDLAVHLHRQVAQ
jgi:hypothetical protein